MIWKVIELLTVFILLIVGFVVISDILPKEPIKLGVNYSEPEVSEIIDYGATPVFAENLRFASTSISYSVGEGCDENRKADMADAFDIFSGRVGLVSFYEGGDATDIEIECSDEFIGLADGLFTAGEGGPSRIINTTGFKVIEKGKILLYKSEDCGYPIVALHELGHVFGFAHSKDPANIMYNTSDCGQRMSDDMVERMLDLYSIESLPDARIDGVSAVISGRYLDFNVSILNEGLRGIDSIYLTILANGKEVDRIDIGEIEIGYGRTLRIENMRMPRSVDKIEFVVDADNSVRELDEDNNAVELIV